MPSTDSAPRLSKSRFLAGLQCPKRLWWQIHEPDARELIADAVQAHILARGRRVGELARSHVPGGVLIDLPAQEIRERVAATARALADGAPVVYEASFVADDVFVAVDILERRGAGFVLTEVKSTLDVKEAHLPDVAIQLHVARRAGLAVHRAELMHLNRECHYPDLSNLFVRAEVTAQLAELLRALPPRIEPLRRAMAGPLPEVATGAHCGEPYECPFLARCWPALPPHHVSTLHRIRAAKVEQLLAAGYVTLHDLPDDFETSPEARRQIRSVREGRPIFEPGLGRALAELRPPLAFLDFETVSPAIPAWPGCTPYQAVPVQFSCHVEGPEGLRHQAWLADGPEDPRRPFAEALLAACAGARTIVAWYASFEQGCLEGLAEALPDLAPALRDLSARTVDLLSIVRSHVYHPEFGGSFSLKRVLPALVPELGYGDLAIADGGMASAALEGMLLEAEPAGELEPGRLREALLRYCERDTLAMVRLHERLRSEAPGPA